MSFDKVFDLTAGVYFNFYNILIRIVRPRANPDINPSVELSCIWKGHPLEHEHSLKYIYLRASQSIHAKKNRKTKKMPETLACAQERAFSRCFRKCNQRILPTETRSFVVSFFVKIKAARTMVYSGVVVFVVVVLTLTRIIKSVVTGQAPVTLELRNCSICIPGYLFRYSSVLYAVFVPGLLFHT